MVKEITPAIISALEDMAETLHSVDGVGLAAPQVGILKRIAVIEFDENFYELINPEIIETEGEQTCKEACLSAPGYYGDVNRPLKLTVKATNRLGEEYSVTVEDYMASVFSHELDHLDGIMYTDKASNLQRIDQEQLEEYKKARKIAALEKTK